MDEQILRHIQGFLDLLKAQGVAPPILDAFAHAPRHIFVNGIYRRVGQGREQHYSFVDSSDAEQYFGLIYSDKALVTQVDPNNTPTSSSTKPSIMALMLQVLEITPGLRVLEIGAGSGYNAAMLAFLVDDPTRVTSIEIDAQIAEQAERAVKQIVGGGVTIHIGNGLDGYEPHAPYDRIIATASFPSIPKRWLEQLRRGGILVMNLRGELAGALLQLTKDERSETAQGRLIDLHTVSFMSLQRHQIDTPLSVQSLMQAELQETAVIDSDTLSLSILENKHFLFFLQFFLPSASLFWLSLSPQEQTRSLSPRLVDHASQTITLFDPMDSGTWRVEVRGTTRMWSMFLNAYTQWQLLGQPNLSDYQVHVDIEGRQTLSFYSSDKRTRDSSLSWPLPTEDLR